MSGPGPSSSSFPAPTGNDGSIIRPATPVAQQFDAQSKTELLLLIHLYLQSDGRYADAARSLFDAIEHNEAIPLRFDINGMPRTQSLESFFTSIRPFVAAQLPTLITHLSRLQPVAAPVSGLPIRLFSSRRNALDRAANEKFAAPPKLQSIISTRPSHNAIDSVHPLRFLQARELASRPFPCVPQQLFRKEYMFNLQHHIRIFGHLSSVFCVAFDRTGRYVLTGADDNLIKVWDAQRYLLRFTFRGHNHEITDMAISHENTLLASGSVDKTIRIWCLRRGTTVRVYRGHTGQISLLQFVPLLCANGARYLFSAGTDCSVVFQRYRYSTQSGETIFDEQPTKFIERATGSARIMSVSCSPGGNLLVIGDTHQSLMMYRLNEVGVERLYEFQAHKDRVDTLEWAHKSLRFVSGSKDGIAKIWTLGNGGRWRSIDLDPFPPSPGNGPKPCERRQDGAASLLHVSNAQQSNSGAPAQTARKSANSSGANNVAQQQYKLTMITWTLDDQMVVSIGSDFLLRTWDWRSGQLLNKYAGHQNETYCLQAHPLHKELVVSAGYDGLLIVWDVHTGRQYTRIRNENFEHEPVPIYDMCVAPDGSQIACVDQSGHLSICGIGHNQEALNRPHEQFFSTDYSSLEADVDGHMVDAETGELPERLPPPHFVKADGSMLGEADQRLVPGNDLRSCDIIKPCAWLKRDIVAPLLPAVLTEFVQSQQELTRAELAEFECKQREEQKHNAFEELIAEHHIHHNKKQLTRRGARRSDGPSRRAIQQQLEAFLQAPSYVIDEDFPEDENDRSYSAGSDEEEMEDEEQPNEVPMELAHFQNDIDERRGNPRRRRAVANERGVDVMDHVTPSGSSERSSGDEASGENGADKEDEDENDSDYELGRQERETVFRERSSWTVTGRRKPRRARTDGTTGATSSQENSRDAVTAQEESAAYFHSARLRARAQQRFQLQQQQQQSSSYVLTLQQQTPVRRIKTRRSAYISTDDEVNAIPNEESAAASNRLRQNIAPRNGRHRSVRQEPAPVNKVRRKKRRGKGTKRMANNPKRIRLEDEEEDEENGEHLENEEMEMETDDGEADEEDGTEPGPSRQMNRRQPSRQMDRRQKPILAKYRCIAEAKAAAQVESHERKKRKAAVSAREIWRNLQAQSEEFDEEGGKADTANVIRRTSRRIFDQQRRLDY